jgi:hypothetical protein
LVGALLFLAGCVGYVVGSRSSTPTLNAVDRGFLVDMSDHHDQAVELSLYELANGQDPVALDFATEVVMQQRQELGQMAMVMDQHDVVRPDLDLGRSAMGWMDMGSPLSDMPGWAQQDDIQALRDARGTAADVLFLQLMQAHHRGGAHMADFAAQGGIDPELGALAGRMARNQRIEVNEYQAVLDRLNQTADRPS